MLFFIKKRKITVYVPQHVQNALIQWNKCLWMMNLFHQLIKCDLTLSPQLHSYGMELKIEATTNSKRLFLALSSPFQDFDLHDG